MNNQPIDTHSNYIEADIGPWIDKITLYQTNNKQIICIEGGYSKPYQQEWYELQSPITKPLHILFQNQTTPITGTNELDLIEEILETTIKRINNPHQHQPNS